ncbi:ABC transporter substrate-binding protein [Roseomonas haemaphysalidis]|uniref:ABC transporter substrate-binding protein n=1 Tax=Roseomonas haemaphysalidis TaxID=2768162 RepID=A0ABS3KV16_9PROT|nr:ABC transporter substrate-binding protein [Roseomonas haemaphysalidis]MBO1081323.1 ABC transporter substrate-binding protein [Roseomonas haemaphysalidis]
MLSRRAALSGLSGLALTAPALRAQTVPTLRIGILQDRSGPASHLGGAGSVACARLAAEEMAERAGLKVELLQADHQNKPDLGMSIARQWIDSGVDALLEFNNSAIALAVNDLVRDRDKVMLANNVGNAALSGRACTPNMTHWTFDTAMLANSLGNALVEQGGDTCFFIRADYTFGQALRDDTAAVVEKRGGRVLGEVAVPVGTTDFASALVRAQASRAKVVALALFGTDLLNCIKQAGEFGIGRRNQKLGALIIYLQDVHSLGLAAAQGTQLTESFYWDLDDRTRAFTRRVLPQTGGVPPNMGQAGAYSATLHYLKAVAALGPAAAKASGRTTVARMKRLPIEDDVLRNARIREDGRVVSDVFLFTVKTPAASKGEWDLYERSATIGPDQAWRSMADGGCVPGKA